MRRWPAYAPYMREECMRGSERAPLGWWVFTLLTMGGVLTALILGGCQSVAEIAHAAAPILADTLSTSLAAQLGESINQAAAGDPLGPTEIAALSDAISGGTRAAVDAALAESQAGGSGLDSFWAGLTGGLSGGGTAGFATWLQGRRKPD